MKPEETSVPGKIRVLITGSFDPVTVGHIDIIRRASLLFDDITVAIFVNIEKTYMFNVDEKMAMLKTAVAELGNIRVDCSSGLVSDYVRKNGINLIIRGVRGDEDAGYEIFMAEVNRKNGAVETLLLPAEKKFEGISSTLARNAIKIGKSVKGIMPDAVIEMENRPF